MSGRASGWAAAAAAALLLAGCGPGAELDALTPSGGGRVTAAPDGDSLVLANGQRVRLAGIEAPRLDDPQGREAQAALARLAVGREVQLSSGGARQDAYGRTLAHARLAGGGLWLQGALLRAGTVRVHTWPDNRALAQAMLREEARARTARRGLWASPAYQVRLPGELGADAPSFAVVEGRVTGLRNGGGWLELMLDGGRLIADVPARARDDFAAADVDLAVLKGRLVRVRGWVEGGAAQPRLRLDHPEQLEPLVER